MAMESFSQLRQGRNPLSLREYWSDAAPSASTDKGPFNKGDIVWNTSPDAGVADYVGWICTTAGADGSTAVFTAFGAIV